MALQSWSSCLNFSFIFTHLSFWELAQQKNQKIIEVFPQYLVMPRQSMSEQCCDNSYARSCFLPTLTDFCPVPSGLSFLLITYFEVCSTRIRFDSERVFQAISKFPFVQYITNSYLFNFVCNIVDPSNYLQLITLSAEFCI